MEHQAVVAALHELDAAHAPAVARFDDGPPPADGFVVLPSAFNPPTRAHLGLLAVGSEATGLQPAAMLTTRNVAKGIHGASLPHRVGMLLAGHKAAPLIAVLVANVARFVDQAAALRETFTGSQIDFVAGYDTLVRIFDPGYYSNMDAELRTFFAAHRLVATNRAEASMEEVDRLVTSASVRPFASRIIVRELAPDMAAMSSTGARQAAPADAHDQHVPPAVADYIRVNRLYR
ncbi:MAG: hypothetical protein KC495_10260 [Dehalococcoidia bacterium]|nr:hypothetical protein [Dehalococcoidia bacterium]